jgi:hypothetical protein
MKKSSKHACSANSFDTTFLHTEADEWKGIATNLLEKSVINMI